ncbi:MAG: hypothetical protein IKW76_02240 [Clostridia bacterium]|nr:hypothetical protein [Clostridia bacterium]
MEKRDMAQELLRLRARMEQSAADERTKERELLRFAGENMDASQQNRLRNVLRDRQALQDLLQSDEAKALLRRLHHGE